MFPIDHIQQWKIQEIWNPFHGQSYLPYFKGILKLWTHDLQELPFRQFFINFANQNIAVLCMKRPWNRFRFSWNFWWCMRSMDSMMLYRKVYKKLSCPATQEQTSWHVHLLLNAKMQSTAWNLDEPNFNAVNCNGKDFLRLFYCGIGTSWQESDGIIQWKID